LTNGKLTRVHRKLIRTLTIDLVLDRKKMRQIAE